MGKVKVVFFADVLLEDFDGVGNTMHQLIKQIPDDLIDPIFITPLPPKKDIGYPVYVCPSIEMVINKGYKLALPKRMKQLPGILNTFHPDVVHWSSPSTLGKYAVGYAKEHKLPNSTIYHTHFPTYAGYYLGFLPGWEKISAFLAKKMLRIYQKADRVFAPTKGMGEFLSSVGVDPNRIDVWGRGIDLSLFSRELRQESFFDQFGVDRGLKKVLFVSRLVKEKETNTLIRLYKIIKESRSDIGLIVTGDGPDRSRMQREMQGAVFTGKLTGKELSRCYASADLFVFPSVTETFGNVVLEAMASGLPVVAANAGGPIDIIKNGETGFLVTPKDEKEFFLTICKIFDQKGLKSKLSERAAAYANKQEWSVLGKQFFNRIIALAGRSK